ncbi:MAG: PHP domain-containing protein [Sphaerochaeta sp.]
MRYIKQNKANLHTHTNFCDHAKGSVSDYVKAAERAGLEALGFTEHAPVPGNPLSPNMMTENLAGYVKAVKAAKKTAKLKVFLAAECDFEPILENFYRDELLGRYGFDYLLCSVHIYFDHDARKISFVSQSKDFARYLSDYTSRYCRALESGLFLFGCHPDLFRASYLPWDENAKAAGRDIIQCAKSLDMPLEINGAGLKKCLIDTPDGKRPPYSTDEFYLTAKDYGLKLCCNSDAHEPELVADTKDCFEMANRLGISFIDWAIDGSGKISVN